MINYGINEKLFKDYGAYEINGLINGYEYHKQERIQVLFDQLTSEDKISLERFRMLSDSGLPFYDISYIHIKYNGQNANLIGFPTMQLTKRKWKSEVVNICKKKGIFIKDLLNPACISILY